MMSEMTSTDQPPSPPKRSKHKKEEVELSMHDDLYDDGMNEQVRTVGPSVQRGKPLIHLHYHNHITKAQ